MAGVCRRQAPADGGTDAGVDGGPDPRECLSAMDCGLLQICTFTGQTVPCSTPPCPLMTECRDRAGRIPLGHACNDDGDCAGAWCHGGVCAQPCRGDADCPGGYECLESTYQPPGGQEGTAGLCLPTSPDNRLCDTSDVCPAGEVCTWDLTRQGRTYCAEPQGTGKSADDCYSGSGCETGVCVNYKEGPRCTNPCVDDLECGPGLACDDMTLTNVPGQPVVPACVPPETACYTGRHCNHADGEWCTLSLSLRSDHFLFLCKNTNGGAPGEPCSGPTDCATGICNPEGFCANLCDTDADCLCAFGPGCNGCTAGDACHLGWRCVPTPLTAQTQNGSFTETVRICRP